MIKTSMDSKNDKPLFVTIPHSGEKVPEFCDWLKNFSETVLMRDVDRFVDQLYGPALERLQIPSVTTPWHRYVGDLNRLATDVDEESVVGSANPKGKYSRGFLWVITTHKERLMPRPVSQKVHQDLVQLIYEPFHESVRNLSEKVKKSHGRVYHLDLHSMPSVGTDEHRDPGETRADIVISDCGAKSASKDFVDLVLTSYARAGFKVAYNWPYLGGRVSEVYGQPDSGHETVQVELKRGLYMDEQTKKLKPDIQGIQKKLEAALSMIKAGCPF